MSSQAVSAYDFPLLIKSILNQSLIYEPDNYKFVDDIPSTSVGRIDEKRIRSLAMQLIAKIPPLDYKFAGDSVLT